MQNDIFERVLLEAEYLIKNGGTVRSLSPIFKVSKSTVHYDLTKRLKKIDLSLYKKVAKILQINMDERHLRGGLATQEKYKKIRKKCKKT